MKVSELIKKLQTFNPDATVMVEALDERQDDEHKEQTSSILYISSVDQCYALTSRQESLAPVQFKFVSGVESDARELVLIGATNQY